jgi:hypothetical protein
MSKHTITIGTRDGAVEQYVEALHYKQGGGWLVMDIL